MTCPLCTPGHDPLFVLEGEAFAVRYAGEGFNRLTQGQAWKLHRVGVEFTESEPPGLL